MGFTNEDYNNLVKIQRTLFDRFEYRTDEEKWKRTEYWEDEQSIQDQFPGIRRFTGDCEEYARTAMRAAQSAGLTARLVVCWTEEGEGHCICEVTDPRRRASYFLDNRQRQVARLQDLKGYRFHSAGPWNPEPGDVRPWVRLVN